jgi:hypothetical protein
MSRVEIHPHDLLRFSDKLLVYLATPYSRYPKGLDTAREHACLIAAEFVEAGVPVFCPIAHSHEIAMLGGLDPKDHDLWARQNEALMEHCDALAVPLMTGWSTSKGVCAEIDFFKSRRRPVLFFPAEIYDD